MCGIVGVITSCKNGMNNKDLEIFEDLLYVDALRGFDSTGAFVINNSGNLDWAKGAVAPYSFLQNKAWKALRGGAFRDGLMLFGHNRKATEGSINNNNAHPFVEGNTTLIHNGSLINWRSLMRHDKREKHGIQVDSHVVAYLFEHENYLDVLKEIDGAYVFVWYNAKEKKLRIARNEERPLHWGLEEKSGSYFFASEGNMLRCIANRRYQVEIKVAHSLKEGLVHTYSIDKDGAYDYDGTEEVPQAKKSYTVYRGGHPVVGGTHAPVVVGTGTLTTTKAPVTNIRNISKVISAENQAHMPASHSYIPTQYRNNMYYGEEMLDSILPYQRVVFLIDDYDYISGSNNHFTFTGFVVSHPELRVRGHYSGEEEALIGLVDKPMMGFIKRVGQVEKDKAVIIVQTPEPCSLVELANGKFMEKAHFDSLLAECKGNCLCQVTINPQDTKDLTYVPGTLKTPGDFMCKQCLEIDEQAALEQSIKQNLGDQK